MRVLRLAVLLACGPALPVAADRSPPHSRMVDLVVAASPEDAALVDDVVRELLERLDVGLRSTRVERLEVDAVLTPDPSAAPAVARAWIDLAASPAPDGTRRATMFLADASWERIRVRHVALDRGVDEVAREELAHMLASGVDGILAGRPLEQTPDEVRLALALPALAPAAPLPRLPAAPQPVAPLPAPPPPAPRSLGFDLGIGYDLTGLADGAPVSHGPFVELGLALARVPLRPALRAALQYRAPLEAQGDPIGARLDQGVFRLLASVDVPLVPRFALALMLGGGLDVVRTTPQIAAGATGRLEPPSTAVFGVVRGAAGLRARLFGATDLLFAAGCDVDVEPRTWVARVDGATQVVLEAWVVRPLVLLALVTDLSAAARNGGAASE